MPPPARIRKQNSNESNAVEYHSFYHWTFSPKELIAGTLAVALPILCRLHQQCDGLNNNTTSGAIQIALKEISVELLMRHIQSIKKWWSIKAAAISRHSKQCIMAADQMHR